MTREEITEKLKSLKADIVSCGGCEGKKDYAQALTETIEALQTEQNAYKEGYDACKRIIAREKQFNSYCPKCIGKLEPCEDCISRQAAMDAIHYYCKNICGFSDYNWCPDCPSERFVGLLKELPPVQPQKVGKWINAKVGRLFPSNDFKCSECGNILNFDGVNCGRGDANFCPNCGAKMAENEEEE